MTPGRRHLGHAELQVRIPDLPIKNVENCRELTRFHVPPAKRGCGAGSRLLQKVCREADGAKKALLICVNPFDEAERTAEQLEAWYGRYGFERIQAEPLVMCRQPRSAFH